MTILKKNTRKLNTVKFIYKYGFFKISITNTTGFIYGAWDSAYFLRVKYITAVVATSLFQFKNIYFFMLMISTIDCLYKITVSDLKDEFYLKHLE